MFNKLCDKAIIPVYQTLGSAGLDLHSVEATIIKAGDRAIIPTGLTIELEANTEGQVRSRSGLAAKNGVFVLNSPGTIDSDYRGEIKVILQNAGSEDFVVEEGARIAQLVIASVLTPSSCGYVDNTRGTGGFGSTGK